MLHKHSYQTQYVIASVYIYIYLVSAEICDKNYYWYRRKYCTASKKQCYPVRGRVTVGRIIWWLNWETYGIDTQAPVCSDHCCSTLMSWSHWAMWISCSHSSQIYRFDNGWSQFDAHGGSEEDIKARIAAAWKKWKDLSGVLCDRRMPTGVKVKVNRTMVRPVLIYGSEAWTLRRREEERLERTEMSVTMDPWSYLEGQEKKWWHPSHPWSSVYHG